MRIRNVAARFARSRPAADDPPMARYSRIESDIPAALATSSERPVYRKGPTVSALRRRSRFTTSHQWPAVTLISRDDRRRLQQVQFSWRELYHSIAATRLQRKYDAPSDRHLERWR
ncbi:hypothetical protein BC835DRAFT_788625 [Cytidiella melzeri]|nr:hypothetical protein BC835DRAFT_788625 [Cytidiella melzeri]